MQYNVILNDPKQPLIVLTDALTKHMNIGIEAHHGKLESKYIFVKQILESGKKIYFIEYNSEYNFGIHEPSFESIEAAITHVFTDYNTRYPHYRLDVVAFDSKTEYLKWWAEFPEE